MKKLGMDPKRFPLGALTVGVLFFTLGSSSSQSTPKELSRLRNFLTCLQPDGNLNLGTRKMIMLGSALYDDGSEGGGLIFSGGAGRIHFFGKTIPHESGGTTLEMADRFPTG